MSPKTGLISSSLWSPTPKQVAATSASKFIHTLKTTDKANLSTFQELYHWSINHPEEFWSMVWDHCEVKGEKGPAPYIIEPIDMLNACWFPQSSLNFSENLLRHRGQKAAVIFYGEDKVKITLSRDELYKEVSSVRAWLLTKGVTSGDVVAGLVPNMPFAIIGMLAAASIGAIWTSCSPDFGASGVIDRFGQTAPKILITCDGYWYRGKPFGLHEKITEIINSIPSIDGILVSRYTESPFPSLPKETAWHHELPQSDSIEFIRHPFNHPLYIMYSSGTTGKPKCIVHGAGGTLLEHLKEHVLHVDLKETDIITYQTTCGWMMWNWLASALAVGATVVLYDGYPFLNDGKVLFELIDMEKITVFGTNAKFIASLEKEGVAPMEGNSLSSLHTILSTGSPLLPENFDFVYRSIKKDVCLSSIAGGTDIIGCFALGTPMQPVYSGELQTRSLGYKVEVWDENGKSVTGKQGELVCTSPFPSQPIGFWNDPEKKRYKASYFERYPNVWWHGDYVELTERGGMIFYGRSDAVLNPGGIRIGTAEIYRQVEKLPEIEESIVIGQEWKGDVRVVLFVKLRPGALLDETLSQKIRSTIKANASPFHVPKKILSVTDIPRTRSGKITELAVRDVVHGREVKNKEALLNPEALELFTGRVELTQD